MADTTNLILPLLAASQAQKHITHNEALLRLDAIVQLAVIDRDLTAPPANPNDGDRYIVASGATGAWASWDLNIAWYVDGVWTKLVPREGWFAWVDDESKLLVWNGAAWLKIGIEGSVGRDMRGVMFWHTGTTPPSGALVLDGAAYTRTIYADFWAWVQTSGNLAASEGAKLAGQYGPGDESTTFTLPDLETLGLFARAYTGTGTFGAYQDWAIENITGSFEGGQEFLAAGSGALPAGAFGNVAGGFTTRPNNGTASTQGIDLDASRVVKTATETRPANVSLLPCLWTE